MPIRDAVDRARVHALAVPIFFAFDEMNIEWLQHHNWAVIPLPSGYLETREEQSRRFARVIRSWGHSHCVGVISDPSLEAAYASQLANAESPVSDQLVPSSSKGFDDFHRQRILSATLLPFDQSFVISFGHNDVDIIAGPKNIVEQLLERTLTEAKMDIIDEAAREEARNADSGIARYLLRMAFHYSKFSR
jgi:hypothetical protein